MHSTQRRGWPPVSNFPKQSSFFSYKFVSALASSQNNSQHFFSPGFLVGLNWFHGTSGEIEIYFLFLISSIKAKTNTFTQVAKWENVNFPTLTCKYYPICGRLWWTFWNASTVVLRWFPPTQLEKFAGVCEIMWLNEVSLCCAGCAAGNSWLMHPFKTSAYSVWLPLKLNHCQIAWRYKRVN